MVVELFVRVPVIIIFCYSSFPLFVTPYSVQLASEIHMGAPAAISTLLDKWIRKIVKQTQNAMIFL
jgi:hypothetical protein